MGKGKIKFSELNGTKQWWSSVKTVATLRVPREQGKPPQLLEKDLTPEYQLKGCYVVCEATRLKLNNV
jgi:hypothetical protein